MAMLSNKTKSKIFFWSVVSCIMLAAALAVVLRLYLSGSGSAQPGRAVRIGRMPIKTDNVRLDNKSKKLYTESGGTRVYYTINPKLQSLAEELLIKYDPVVGVIVGLEPKSGAARVIAVYSRKRSDYFKSHPYESLLDPIARSSTYPMASIAKIVTSSAAIRAGLYEPESVFDCNGRAVTSGGSVVDAVGEMHGRITMSEAFAKSCNSTFAKIALKVGREKLLDEFERFQFNNGIDFDLPLLESTAAFEDNDYSLARSGAGYEGARMSPIHAALIAATINAGGVMPRPFVIDEIEKNGRTVYHGHPTVVSQPITKKQAELISSMFYGTVHEQGGTAFKGFYKGGSYQAGNIKVVGKTGSLNGNDDNESYTWFVGYVESGDPGIAFATMILNDGKWTIKAASFTGQFFKTIAYTNR